MEVTSYCSPIQAPAVAPTAPTRVLLMFLVLLLPPPSGEQRPAPPRHRPGRRGRHDRPPQVLPVGRLRALPAGGLGNKGN